MGLYLGVGIFKKVIKVKWGDTNGLVFHMTGVLMRRGEDTHYKRKQCDDGIRDWNRAATSQGMPRITCSHQKLRETRNDSSLEPSEGPQPCRHFDIRLLALRTVREQFFIVFGHLKTYPLFGTLL